MQKNAKGTKFREMALHNFIKGKRTVGYPHANVFLSFSDQINFWLYFERGDVSECRVCKMFRIGPVGSLTNITSFIGII